MKAAVCSINSQYIHSSLAPWCLKAGYMAYGKGLAQIQVLEGTINQPLEEVLNAILSARPDALAFCCYIWNIQTVRALLLRLQEVCPQLPVLLGGPEATFNAGQLLEEFPQVCAVLCGEGEEIFPLAVDALAQHAPLHAIEGVACRLPNGRIHTARPYANRLAPPSPYTEEYFAALNGRIAYLETSRGCPFCCAFCLSGVDHNVQFFPLAQAKENLLKMANSGAKIIKLVDRTFNANNARAYEIVRFLIEKRQSGEIPDVCFHFEVGADLFKEDILALFATAPKGLFQIEAGLQSFHPQTLQAVQRKTDIDKLCHNLRALIGAGNMHVHIDLIAGLPYEDFETFSRSFDMAFALRPHMLQLGFLKLLHGSLLRRQANLYGYVFDPLAPYEIRRTNWLNEEEFAVLHAVEDALERLYNSGRFAMSLNYLLKATGARPFAFFEEFGLHAQRSARLAGISLDSYTQLFYEYFKEKPQVDKGYLRDMLVLDRLSCENTGRLPGCLRIPDKRLKTLDLWAQQQEEYKQNRGKKAGIGILYSAEEEQAVLVNYRQKDPITGRFPAKVSPLGELLQKMARG